jgi:hypothetical protein
MALDQITKRVLTVYSADASGQRQELVKLEIEVDKLKDKEEDANKKRTGGLREAIQAIGEVGRAYSTLSHVAGEAFDLMKDAAERSRMETAAQGAELDKLKTAAGNTRSEMELLTFAAHAQHGAMKLNEDQMEMAQRAMRQLGREGFDLTQIQDGITTAITKGSAKSLKELGFSMEEASDKGNAHAQVLEFLAGKAAKLDTSYTTTSEGVQAGSASMTDSLDQVKEAAGRLATNLLPLVKALADLGAGAANFIDKISKDTNEGKMARLAGGGDTMAGLMNRMHSLSQNGMLGDVSEGDVMVAIQGSNGAKDMIDRLRKQGLSMQSIAKLFDYHGDGSGNEAAHNDFAQGGEKQQAIQKAATEYTDKLLDAASSALQSAFSAGVKRETVKHEQVFRDPDVITKLQRYVGSRIDDIVNDAVAAVAGVHMNMGDEAQFRRWSNLPGSPSNDNRTALQKIEAVTGKGSAGLGGLSPELRDTTQEEQEFSAQAAADKTAALAAKNERKTKFLEGTFGKLSEFDAYKQAFGALSGAVGSAMGAWIDGSKSAGAAFKEFIGQALKGLAVQMEIEALKHAAYALGSLAFGDFSGAGRHAIAAAAFAAGGIAAGFAAKELGAERRVALEWRRWRRLERQLELWRRRQLRAEQHQPAPHRHRCRRGRQRRDRASAAVAVPDDRRRGAREDGVMRRSRDASRLATRSLPARASLRRTTASARRRSRSRLARTTRRTTSRTSRRG